MSGELGLVEYGLLLEEFTQQILDAQLTLADLINERYLAIDFFKAALRRSGLTLVRQEAQNET